MATHLTLTIIGCPRTKKTSQRIIVNRKTNRPMLIPAKNSKAWEVDAVDQLRRQWDGVPLDCDVTVRALIYRDANRGDLVGYLQAIGDALQGGGSRMKTKRKPCVLLDDSQIMSWDGARLLIDKERPRVELLIEPYVD
jgi:hypothetical protein